MCGSVGGDDRKFIDFGKQLDWYGAVYFCTECIKEFATAVDFIAKSAFDALYRDFQKLQVAHDKLTLRNRAVEDAFRTVLGNNDSPIDDLVNHPVASIQKSDTGVEANSGSIDGDKETEHSPSVEGSDDLFDSDDFE
jgi:hypothetical protein